MVQTDRTFGALGAGTAGTGVALGAFAAHGLRGHLSPEMLAVFETGVRYQLVHGLALLAAAWASTRWPGRTTRWAGWCFLAGTLLFSGSLYLLALTGVKILGAITPLGGVAFLAECYRRGLFIVSGRQDPPAGGVILAKEMPREELELLLEEDGYARAGVARYEVIRFNPASHDPLFAPFMRGAKSEC